MTAYRVSSGRVFTSNLGRTDTATVLSGGETLGVSDDGFEVVSSGGVADGAIVLSQGILVLSLGATATGET